MDGNGRWAVANGLPRLEGHREGANKVMDVVRWCKEADIPYVTFYAFSAENWARPPEEVSGIFALFKHYFRHEMFRLHKENVRVRFIGDRTPTSKLSPDILEIMNDVEIETKDNTEITAVFAINYSGRDEILRAATAFAQDVGAGKKYAEDVNEVLFHDYLDTADMPEVDLIVRTGGEKRLSNFLLWQASYAELAFVPAYWPDFDKEAFIKIMGDFWGRHRKFGRLDGEDVSVHMETGKVEMF